MSDHQVTNMETTYGSDPEIDRKESFQRTSPNLQFPVSDINPQENGKLDDTELYDVSSAEEKEANSEAEECVLDNGESSAELLKLNMVNNAMPDLPPVKVDHYLGENGSNKDVSNSSVLDDTELYNVSQSIETEHAIVEITESVKNGAVSGLQPTISEPSVTAPEAVIPAENAASHCIVNENIIEAVDSTEAGSNGDKILSSENSVVPIGTGSNASANLTDINENSHTHINATSGMNATVATVIENGVADMISSEIAAVSDVNASVLSNADDCVAGNTLLDQAPTYVETASKEEFSPQNSVNPKESENESMHLVSSEAPVASNLLDSVGDDQQNGVEDMVNSEVAAVSDVNASVLSNADDCVAGNTLLDQAPTYVETASEEEFSPQNSVNPKESENESMHLVSSEAPVASNLLDSLRDDQQNVTCSSDLETSLSQEVGLSANESYAAENVLSESASSVEFKTDDRTDEEIFKSIREPEEPDHHSRCGVESHDDSVAAILKDIGYDIMAAATKSEWVTILDQDRLRKRTLRPGLDGVRADYGKVATVRCYGRLEDGTEIDQYDSLKLVLGDGDFIEAFDLCIPLMEKQEVCEFVTDSQLAYGKLGRSPDVPPNARLTYEVELLDLEEETKYSTLPIRERVQLSDLRRERGNYLYERKDGELAVKQYAKALKIIDDDCPQGHTEDSSELQLLVDTRVKCYNNLAAAQLQMKQYDAALKSVNHVLRIQPENVKALYRKGKCLENKGDYEGALSFLRKAVKLEPDTKVIQQDLTRLEKRHTDQVTSQKKMYRKMLGTDKKPDQGKATNEGSQSWLWYALGVATTAVAVTASIAMYRRYGNL